MFASTFAISEGRPHDPLSVAWSSTPLVINLISAAIATVIGEKGSSVVPKLDPSDPYASGPIPISDAQRAVCRDPKAYVSVFRSHVVVSSIMLTPLQLQETDSLGRETVESFVWLHSVMNVRLRHSQGFSPIEELDEEPSGKPK